MLQSYRHYLLGELIYVDFLKLLTTYKKEVKKMKKYTPKLKFLYINLFLLLFTVIFLTAGANISQSTATETKQKKSSNTERKLAQLEKKYDARLGVYAIDTGTNSAIEYRSNERFAYASTYKAFAAAILLQKKSAEKMNEVIKFTEEDLVTYSPITEKYVNTGMTLFDLSEAAVRFSDNTAGNLILEALGGPRGFERSLRKIGDSVTEVDRYEPNLNDFTPGDSRDTSTPKVLATNLKKIALNGFLSDDKQAIFFDWIKGNATGDTLIRAGAPKGSVVGDKSGAASYGTRNDVAIVWRPNKEPIVIAIMSRYNSEDAKYDDKLIEEAANITLKSLN